MRNLALLTFFAAAAVVPRLAAAEPVVLAVDKGLVYIDLGGRDGVGAGTELELVREVVVKDPVSKQTLRDKFALGTLTVIKAGDKVCQAQPAPALAARVRPGDEIRIASETRTFVDPWMQKVLASRTAPEVPQPVTPVVITAGTDRATAARAVEESLAARAAWETTLGKAPSARAEIWRAFLTARPQSPYAPAIRTEIASLTQQAVALDAASKAAITPEPVLDRRRALASELAALSGPGQGVLWVAVPARVAPNRPIAVAFATREPVTLAAWLYVRPGGSDSFRRVALAADGDAYLRAVIPAELVSGDRVEWFVELGEGESGVASKLEPEVIQVDRDAAEPPPAPERTQIALRMDYVDFDGGFGKGYDQYREAEAEFAYRFLRPVHTVRVGFGSLSGKGGPKDVIDGDTSGQCLSTPGDLGSFQCKSVDFTYVYTEVELRAKKAVAFMIRPEAGLLTSNRPSTMASADGCKDTSDIADCQFETTLGLRTRVRFGEERNTNLVLSAALTAKLGTLFEAAYNWAPRYEFPVHLAVQVTDLPAKEDYGVRLITEVGWRERAWVYPSLRLSYQARDIDHLGISGGLGLNFDW